jgi:hypothetical protein
VPRGPSSGRHPKPFTEAAVHVVGGTGWPAVRTTPVDRTSRFGSFVPTSDIACRERLSFGGEPAPPRRPRQSLSACTFGLSLRPHKPHQLPDYQPLEQPRVRSSKRGEAEDFATPSAQDRLPTIEARRDSSIQLPSGSRIIDIRTTFPSVASQRRIQCYSCGPRFSRRGPRRVDRADLRRATLARSRRRRIAPR